MAYIILYVAVAGMVALYLLDILGVLGDEVGQICWVLFIFCFVLAMYGVHNLRDQCKCPYCKAWNRNIPSPWKANDVKRCNHCGKLLEYDDK